MGVDDIDDKTLFKMCLSRRSREEICKMDNFWERRLETRFPNFLQYKPENMSSSEYYIFIVTRISKIIEISTGYNYDDISENNLLSIDVNAALIASAIKGYLDVMKFLIEVGGADPRYNYDEPLKVASSKGQLEVVKYLVDKGADIHTTSEYPLRWASNKGYLDVVKYLVDNGADIHINNDSILESATTYGMMKVVKYLIDRDYVKNDSLMEWAIKEGHTDLANYLKSKENPPGKLKGLLKRISDRV